MAQVETRREAVFKVLRGSNSPLTANQVCDAMRASSKADRKKIKSTLYDLPNLPLFSERGVFKLKQGGTLIFGVSGNFEVTRKQVMVSLYRTTFDGEFWAYQDLVQKLGEGGIFVSFAGFQECIEEMLGRTDEYPCFEWGKVDGLGLLPYARLNRLMIGYAEMYLSGRLCIDSLIEQCERLKFPGISILILLDKMGAFPPSNSTTSSTEIGRYLRGEITVNTLVAWSQGNSMNSHSLIRLVDGIRNVQ